MYRSIMHPLIVVIATLNPSIVTTTGATNHLHAPIACEQSHLKDHCIGALVSDSFHLGVSSHANCDHHGLVEAICAHKVDQAGHDARPYAPAHSMHDHVVTLLTHDSHYLRVHVHDEHADCA
jgi:hypothetical protein